MAAHVTAGTPWPDGAPCDKGSVVLISAEDDIADTIRPRLEIQGADLKRIHFIETVTFCEGGRKKQRLFSVQEDLDALGKALDEIGDVRLVAIDPLSAFLGECDSHVNAEVRGLMGPFAKLAAKYNAAFLTISHLNKGEGNALYRITGSLAFVALARAAFLLTHDKEKLERRLLLRIKNNLSPLRTGLAFSLVAAENSHLPTLAWEEGTVDMTANDALAPAVKEKGKKSLSPLRSGCGRSWPMARCCRKSLRMTPRGLAFPSQGCCVGLKKRLVSNPENKLFPASGSGFSLQPGTFAHLRQNPRQIRLPPKMSNAHLRVRPGRMRIPAKVCKPLRV